MKSVLYVDDESPLLDLCKLFLERTGDFTIDTHTSAQSALEALTKTSFDCIVSDYQMPEMDGIQFLQALRSQGDTTPFIIFTGKGREEVAIQALNSGADFYLQKGGEAKAQFIELAHMITQAVRRKRGEEALRESEKRYRNVVESQTEFIVRFLPDGTHKVANAAYCRYFGKSCEEMINSRFIPNIQEKDKGRVREHFTSLTPENSVATIEYRIVMPDGSVRWQQWSDRAIFDANGTLLEYQSVGRDITERKRAEEELLRKNEELQAAYEEVTTAEEELRQNYDELVAMEKKLRESEQRYRNVVEDQTELISRFLPDGTHVFVNEAYCRYFNKKREEILGTKFIPEIPEEDQSFVKQHFASLNRNTPVAMIEHRIVMPGGRVRWQRWSDRAIFDADGQVTEYQSVGRDITSRKEAEELLLRSEIRYRSLFEGVPVGLYRTTPAGQILDANPALMHILGYPDRESLLAISVPDLYANPEARKEWQARIEHEGIVRNFEVQFRTCDGIIIWARETSKVVRDTSGQIVYYEGILEDITERKRVEEALLGREIQLTNAMNLANLVNWEYDIDSRMFTFDDRFYGLYGTSAEREGGTLMPADIYFREFVHPDDLPTVLNVVRAVQETIDSQHTVQLEHRIIRRDGEVRDIVVRLTGIVNNEGRIVRHFGANQDITDRKRAEGALRESEEKYRAFFTTSMDCVFITSIDGRWLDFNDSAVRFFGYAGRDELQKVNVRDLYENSRDRKRHLAYIKEKGYSKEYPVNLKKKDGTIINTLITTVPRKDRDGIIIGFQGTIQDITERKQIEEELRRKNEELHGAYEELTTTEEELRQNYDELSKAERNLRESEGRYRVIFENTGTATVLVEENTIISLANAEFERLSGYSKEEIERKKSWTEFVVKDDLDRMSDQHRLRRERQEAALKHYEFRFITKSGDIRNILLTVDIIPDSKRSVASLMDITEPKLAENDLKRKNEELNAAYEQLTSTEEELRQNYEALTRSEQALRSSEERYRLLFRNMLDGFAYCRMIFEKERPVDFTYLVVNNAFEKLTGLKNVTGKNVTEVIPGIRESNPEIFEIYGRVAMTGRPERFEVYLESLKIWLSVSVYSGERGYFVAVFDNITKRKQDEESLRQVNRQLNLLTSITRHDILNKTTVLLGYLDLAKMESPIPVRLTEMLEKLETATRAIQSQIEFTRVYQNLGTHEPQWQNIDRAIPLELVPDTVRVITDLTAVEVYADPILKKVFTNLLDNSLRHGGKVTTVRVSGNTSPDGLIICWEDDGIGVATGEKEKIFELGYGKHTGLGLFFAREVLTITGITIRETGIPGKGARFEITVPPGKYRFTDVVPARNPDTMT